MKEYSDDISPQKIEVVLGGIKAIYRGGATIELVDRLTDKMYGSIDVWDYVAGKPRIEPSVYDVRMELDREVHYEEYG